MTQIMARMHRVHVERRLWNGHVRTSTVQWSRGDQLPSHADTIECEPKVPMLRLRNSDQVAMHLNDTNNKLMARMKGYMRSVDRTMIRGDQLPTCKCDRTQANTKVLRNHGGLDDSGSATRNRIAMKTHIQSKVHTSSSSGSGNASALTPSIARNKQDKERGFKTSVMLLVYGY